MTKIFESPVIEERYERARTIIHGWKKNKMALNTTIFPIWISGTNKLWFRKEVKYCVGYDIFIGVKYCLVDAENCIIEDAFDHSFLAEWIYEETNTRVDARDLPLEDLIITYDSRHSNLVYSFKTFGRQWRYCSKTKLCEKLNSSSASEVISPDGRKAAFIKDYNIWLKNINSDEFTPLTLDGEQEYSYGATGSCYGYEMSGGPQILWSPDSKKIFTVQRDLRKVKKLPVVYHVPQDENCRPITKNIPVAYPGDQHLETLRLVVIDIHSKQEYPLNYPAVPVTRNSFGYFDAHLGWWNKNSEVLYFVDLKKGYQKLELIEYDIRNNNIRTILEETSDTYISLMLNQDEIPSFAALPDTDELLWYSEKSGWAHLYLYDLLQGKLKRVLTSGNWLVRGIIRYVPERREIFVQTAGRQKDYDIYYRDLARINLDTGEMDTVVSSNDEYVVIPQRRDMLKTSVVGVKDNINMCGVSESGDYIVATKSRADSVPITALYDRKGRMILEIIKADVSSLIQGWKWPEPVKLKAADGLTDIYGLVFRPSYFNEKEKYPILTHGFHQPEIMTVSKGSFTNNISYGRYYFDAMAIAELGFIVVQLDGRGGPMREKSFKDFSYGCMENASFIDDHVVGIKQLAKKYPCMDINRVGITAALSGGFGAVQGLLKHPDFFKVGVSIALHDSRLMSSQMSGNIYEGFSEGGSEYQHIENFASNLKGRLLLMCGMLDTTTPPAITFRLVDALYRCNKNFDLVLLPRVGHSIDPYFIRRAWDYLVENLLCEEPPRDFSII